MKTLLKASYCLTITLFLISCQSNDDNLPNNNLATIISETNANTVDITFTSLKISGNITSNGGSEIVSRGVCWSTDPNPTIEDNSTSENNNVFISVINNLITNTTYYFRVYAVNSVGISYGEEQTFTTLNLDNTDWEVTTYYSQISDFSIVSEVNFYDDNTTKFDELDLPGQCPGCFITYGSWSLNGNNLTYIWEGDDENNSTYVYSGTISEMVIEGNYSHNTAANGIWSASLL